ncbi:MAG: 30S ribosomal protein S1 [Clostridiales bacterium]|nr:30S ribosomal protein S1 [Clostridiales bacterium]
MTEAIYQTEGNLLFTEENREYLSSLEGLERAMNEGRILEAVASRCSSTLTLSVELGDYTGTIEKEEAVLNLDGEPIKDIAVITRVGKPVCFKIVRIERQKVGDPKIILSRRLAQLECVANYLSGLIPGDIIPAKVTHLEHFGAFVDIGCGVVSLLSIDCISISRITHPRDRLSVGSELSVVVRSVEKGDTNHNSSCCMSTSCGMPKRIFVSRKELLGTWEENAARFSVGQTVTGIVRSVESYGIFIELTPNLAGLAEYRDDVAVGQTAAVYIKSIIPERMKIKLVIVDSYRGISPRRLINDGISGKNENTVSTSTHHINSWKYSPDCCERLIESVFE